MQTKTIGIKDLKPPWMRIDDESMTDLINCMLYKEYNNTIFQYTVVASKCRDNTVIIYGAKEVLDIETTSPTPLTFYRITAYNGTSITIHFSRRIEDDEIVTINFYKKTPRFYTSYGKESIDIPIIKKLKETLIEQAKARYDKN